MMVSAFETLLLTGPVFPLEGTWEDIFGDTLGCKVFVADLFNSEESVGWVIGSERYGGVVCPRSFTVAGLFSVGAESTLLVSSRVVLAWYCFGMFGNTGCMNSVFSNGSMTSAQLLELGNNILRGILDDERCKSRCR
jgi:hypothetical protein